MAKPPKRNDYSKKGSASRAGKPAPAKSRYIPSKDKGKKKHAPAADRQESGRPAMRGPRENSAPRRDHERDDRSPRRENAPTQKKGLKADLFGLHAVREAWANPKRYVHSLYITETALKDFEPYLDVEAKRPAPTIVTKEELDKAFPSGTVHQGLAMSVQALAEVEIMDIIIKAQAKGGKSVIVMLDQVTDPHNIGAILRSACAFGADGAVMQSKHAPEMNGILAKTACGAVEHIPVAYETNLSRALETLKEYHYTVIGLDEHSDKNFTDLPKYERAVIVLGAEGPGMRRLIKEHCDVLVTLPTQKPINSLNVSNAAAVALYALCSG